MILHTKEPVEIDGLTGVLLRITQNANGTEFAKWMVVFGSEKETHMVLATFPIADEAELSGQLKAAVLSAKVDDAPPPAPGAHLGFTIAASDI